MTISYKTFYKAIIILFVLTALASYELIIASPSTGLGNSDWPMYQHDLRHSGQSTLSGVSSDPWIIWKTFIPYRGYGAGEAPTGMIKGIDNTIYTSQSGGLYAIDLRDGSIKWASSFYSVDADGTPAFGDDGRLYWGIDDTFACISDTGQIAWRWVGLSGNSAFVSSPAISNDGSIYFSHDALWSFSQNGAFNWLFPYQFWNHTPPAISPDGTIYVADSAKLYALNPNGSLKWSRDVGIGTPTATIDLSGTVYIGTNAAQVFAFDPNGSQKWRYTADEYIYDYKWGLLADNAGFGTAPAIGPDGTIYLATYYTGGVTDTHHLYALNPDGSLKWKVPFPGVNPIASITAAPVVDKFNRIFICAGDNGFVTHGACHAFDSNGNLLWTFDPGSNAKTAPLIASDGIMIIQTGGGFVYAIGDDSVPRPYVTPTYLNKTVWSGSAPFTLTIQITSTVAPISWTAAITTPLSWITMPINTGITPGQLQFVIDPSSLPMGTYTMNLLLDSDLGAIHTQRIVPITVMVSQKLYMPLISK